MIPVSSETAKDARVYSVSKRNAVSHEYMSLSRIIGIGCRAKLLDLEGGATISLYLANQVEISDWKDVVKLSGSFGVIAFSDGGRVIRALSGIDMGERSGRDDSHLTWLYASILGRLQGTPLGCADQIVREDLTLIDDAVVMRVVVRSAAHVFSVHAYASSKSWLTFLTSTAWQKLQRPDYECMSLLVDVPVILGRHRCSAKTVKGLKVGDIVLPEIVNFLCSGEGGVNIGSLRLRVMYQAPRSLKIIEVEKKLEDSESQSTGMFGDNFNDSEVQEDFNDQAVFEEESDSESGIMQSDHVLEGIHGNDNLAALDTLPVVLDLELGRIRVMMGELKSIGAGVVLPFEGGSPSSVAIASSGRVLGRGEIVEINGQIGIRITQWGTEA